MCEKRRNLLGRLFKGFTLSAGAGMFAWVVLVWGCVKIPEKRHELLDRLTSWFVMAASIGMAAWAVLAWASVQISKHACDGCCEE